MHLTRAPALRLGRHVVVLIAAATALAAGCRREAPAALPEAPGLSVVLISLDTTRADRLGCYGYERIRTPNIDLLAAEGTLFEYCITTAPITLPAHASLMTGVYPFVHQVRDNGIFRLHEDNRTLPAIMSEAGYHTHAEVAAYVLNREFGLDNGFESYEDVRARPGVDAGLSGVERSAESVSDNAVAWLRANRDARFLLFLHYFDPHMPYTPPPRFLQQYDDPYLAEIAYVDEQVGRVLDALREIGREHDTLVVLTGDHGEGLGEHQELTHAFYVYDSTLRVPLIFRAPGRIPAGQRVAAQVSLVDVAPTILALLGLPPLKPVQGSDLRPMLGDPRLDPGRPAYAETFYPRYNLGYSQLRAWRADGWKYIHAPRPELYHVAQDPGEQTDLAAAEPQRVAAMRQALYDYVRAAPQVVSPAATGRVLSAEDEARLAALGYLGGAAHDVDDDGDEEALLEPSGANPRDHAAELEMMARVMAIVEQGDPVRSEQALRRLLERAPEDKPGFAWAFGNLAGILAQRGAYAESLPYFEKSLRANPRDGQMQTNYGVALLGARRIDDAVRELARSVTLEPVRATSFLYFALALVAADEIDDALVQFEQAVALDPPLGSAFAAQAATFEPAAATRPAAHDRALQLAAIAAAQGMHNIALRLYEAWLAEHPDDAVVLALAGESQAISGALEAAAERLGRAVELAPEFVRAWDFLGTALRSLGRVDEALSAFRRGMELMPENPSIANELAWIYATSPDESVRDGAEAVRLAEIARRTAGDENASVLDTYAAALAEAGRFEEAVQAMDLAIAAAERLAAPDFVEQLRARRALYESGQPYREPE